MDQTDDRDVQEAIASNQWVYGQLFPEMMSPGPMPRDFKHKTHVFSSTFNDTVSIWNGTSFDPTANTIVNHPERKGKVWVYFSPMNDLLSLSSALSIGVDQTTLNNSAIFYSSSNGPLPYSAFQIFDYREITLNSSSKKNLSLLGYKKLRVTSAALVITQIGPKKNRSGILKIGLGFKGAIESVPSINFDSFQSYFNMSEIIHLSTCSKVICRYRLPANMTDKFAPFDPTLNIPYFFIYGEGISPTMSLEIKVTRHFEGIVLPEYSSFHDSAYQPQQYPFSIQNKVIRTVERKQNIIHAIYEPHVQVSTSQMPLLTRGKGTGVEVAKGNEPEHKGVIAEIRDVIFDIGLSEFQQQKDSLMKTAREEFLKAVWQVFPNSLKDSLGPIVEKVSQNYDPDKGLIYHLSLVGKEAAKNGIKTGWRALISFARNSLIK